MSVNMSQVTTTWDGVHLQSGSSFIPSGLRQSREECEEVKLLEEDLQPQVSLTPLLAVGTPCRSVSDLQRGLQDSRSVFILSIFFREEQSEVGSAPGFHQTAITLKPHVWYFIGPSHDTRTWTGSLRVV